MTAGPVDAGAVFELGSITKAVTGLLLADAAVRGEVALDEPLAACLPGARPRAPITLQELATHTAGLPRLPLGYLRRHAIRHRADPYARSTLPELLHDLERVRPRGRRRRYSNFGAALLGQALAARLGAPYEDLVHERVLGPLGVGEVWARGAPPVATPHDRRGRPVAPWTMGAYAPAGCLRGTAAGTLALSLACMAPPEPMAAAVALALTPRKRRGPLQTGLGWMRSPAGRGGPDVVAQRRHRRLARVHRLRAGGRRRGRGGRERGEEPGSRGRPGAHRPLAQLVLQACSARAPSARCRAAPPARRCRSRARRSRT